MSNDWHRLALGELIRLQKGVSYKGEFLDKPGPWLLGLGTIALGGGLMLDKARTYAGPIRNGQRAHPSDLLVAVVGISPEGSVIGSPALIPPNAHGEFAITHHVARAEIVSKDLVDVRFLYYLLRDRKFADYVRRVQYGSTVPAVSIPDVLSYEAAFPPVAEQRAIARVLGSLDDKIELNRQMNQTLEQIAQALFKSWFIDFDPVHAKADGRWKRGESLPGMPADMWELWPSEFEESEIGEIPKGWEVRPVSAVIGVNPERRLLRGQEAPYVEMGKLPTSGARVTGWVVRGFGSGSRFRNGDTLVARITPCLENGKTAYVDFLTDAGVGWGSTEFLVLSPKPPLPTQWAYLLARTDDFRNHLIQNMSGTSGRQRAPAVCLDSYLMPTPVAVIAQRFGSIVGPWFESMKRSDAESNTLASTRDALLPKLFSGEIRVRGRGTQ